MLIFMQLACNDLASMKLAFRQITHLKLACITTLVKLFVY